jgi:hypothetical protein
VHTEAAEEAVVGVPDGEEDGEAEGEGIETEEDLVELVVGVWGTSEETTRRVRAKPKTTSEKPSMREAEVPRRRKPSFSMCP